MDRRDFVRVSALAGVALGGKPLFGETLAGEATPKVLKRRFDVAPFELEETTIGDLQAAMASGRMTARSITQEGMSG